MQTGSSISYIAVLRTTVLFVVWYVYILVVCNEHCTHVFLYSTGVTCQRWEVRGFAKTSCSNE